MLRSILLAACLCMATAGMAQQHTPAENKETAAQARISFAETFHDFGDIRQGQQVEYTFKFTNTGTQVLRLSRVHTTCGCTAIDWPMQPLAPGASGQIKARFDSTGKHGIQNKVIAVVSNAANGQEHLILRANVVATGR